MKKKVYIPILLVALLSFFLFFSKKEEKGQTVGIIVPMEHEALTQIVSGLKEELKGAASIKVMNAQGDINIQRAAIEQLVKENCDVLIPIGTSTAQMTLNLAKGQHVVCLAADKNLISSDMEQNATALEDEVSVDDSLAFLHGAFPEIKKVTLIYSTAERIGKDVPLFVAAAKARHIAVQKLMIQSLPELYTVSRSIHKDSGAIVILKDHMIVSGIQTIVEQAKQLQIPVMTSDEGSVINGGAFAIGVKEVSIGSQGGEMVKSILQGIAARNIPAKAINGPFPLFVNKRGCESQGVSLEHLLTYAAQTNTPVEFVGGE